METIIVKSSVYNSPHILASGTFDAVLVGQSDELQTEQTLTDGAIPFGAVRGTPRILLQAECRDDSFLVNGIGSLSLFVKDISTAGFEVSAVHSVPAGETVNVRIHWFAYGYEGVATPEVILTERADHVVPYPYCEQFSNVTSTLTLARTPIYDATLIVWSDRIAMFYGVDFTISGKVITINSPLTGAESVIVTYTART